MDRGEHRIIEVYMIFIQIDSLKPKYWPDIFL